MDAIRWRPLFAHDPLGVKELWLADGLDSARRAEFAGYAKTFGVPVHSVARNTLDRMSEGGVHQGVVARFRATAKRRRSTRSTLDDLLQGGPEAPLLLLLDGVEDPRNLGACVRSAAAAAASAVIVPRSRGASLSPEATKAAAGGAELVPVVEVPNLARCMTELGASGVTLVGAVAGAAQRLYDADLTEPCALVLGGEGRGLRRLTQERCDRLVSIPMASTLSSLNVSVAAGICLFEARRQRDQRE